MVNLKISSLMLIPSGSTSMYNPSFSYSYFGNVLLRNLSISTRALKWNPGFSMTVRQFITSAKLLIWDEMSVF